MLLLILILCMGYGYGSNLDPHQAAQLDYPHQYHQRMLTCKCTILGVNGAEKEALKDWISRIYGAVDHDQDYGHVTYCTAPACYRADFIDVGRPVWGGRHFTVFGCSDPGHFYGDAAMMYKVHHNVSLSDFASEYSGGFRARFVLELQCTHGRCQEFDLAQWDRDQYVRFIEEVSSGSGYANMEIGMMMLSVITILINFF